MKMTEEQKKARSEERKERREREKREAQIMAERNQKPVKSVTITIQWKRSRVWGSNPHAEAAIQYKDGSFSRLTGFKCSGCGYDKESTVIASIFNTALKYKLWQKNDDEIRGGHGSEDTGPAPYGINSRNGARHYDGGIGTNCYYKISEYIGGTFEHVASGKMFDVYKYTDKEA